MSRLWVLVFVVGLAGCLPPPQPESAPPKPSGAPRVSGPKSGFNAVPRTSVSDHVPQGPEFGRILRSDLEEAFLNPELNDERLDYELLDKVPVRLGNEFPRFFAWVKVTKEGQGVVREGVVILAAMHKASFNVGEIVPKKDLKDDLAGHAQAYPAEIVEEIKKRL